MKRPLLSICIPTMNRVKLLEIGLQNLLSETDALGEDVEVVVTDNGSNEDVEELVRRMSPRIRFGRLEKSQVFPRSIMFGPREIATGEYTWIIGDDDLVVRGSVRRIVDFLKCHPDLEYVYLNHGWLPIETRNRRILEFDSRLPEEPSVFQCVDPTSRVLNRFEDLIPLANTSPYAMFSTIFCYISKRRLYLDHADLIHPLDEWDDRIQTLDNMFPHSKLTMTVYAGKPVGYIGEPCFAQGSYHQESKTWIFKTMIYGSSLLFAWLEETRFDKEVLKVLWEALAHMAGRVMVRLLDNPDEHFGQDIVREKALPLLVKHPCFLEGLYAEARDYAICDYEARWLAAHSKAVVEQLGIKDARLAIWGVRGRGWMICKHDAWCRKHAVAVVDKASGLHGDKLAYTDRLIEDPAVIAERRIDVLIVATRWEVIPKVFAEAMALVQDGTALVSLGGCKQVVQGELHPLVVEACLSLTALGLPARPDI